MPTTRPHHARPFNSYHDLLRRPWLVCVLLLGLAVQATPALAEADAETPNRTTVVWITIDGVRHDYVHRANTPALDRLIATGLHTRALVPTFPSVTFASHASQATGVLPRDHGVPANAFYDRRRQRTYHYPPFANLLQAEPIWFTATRQQIRTAVGDWPLAHWQEHHHIQTAHHNQRFDAQLSDRERLEQLIDVWQNDTHEQPLQLLMTWIGDVDKVGHEAGPDAPEVVETFEQTDVLLGWFAEAIHAQWQRTARDGDTLYLLLTTDHGMAVVHTLVNLYPLVGLPRDRDDITLVTTGNVGHIHLDRVEADDEREAIIATALAAADKHDFIRIWRRDDLPEQWQYDHPTRTGDLVAVLTTGHTFSVRPEGVTAPIGERGGPRGMHGYDPADEPDMLGFALIHRWPEPLGGREIKRIEALQLHPTVARLLGIAPAEGATAEPVDLAPR
ncbi:MAG: nucleotide pyrophosphatase/phosphodiesterase family protein [Phycisphaeraceae bacterium]